MNFYLLYGTDTSIIGREIDIIKEKLSISDNDVIYYNIEDIQNVVDEALTISMFSANKLIVIDSTIYLSQKKDIENINLLENYFNNYNSNSYLVFVSNSDTIDSRKKLVKFINSNGTTKKVEANNEYLSDYVKENYDEEYGLNVKLHILFNKLHLLYEAVVLSDILNKLIDKNKKINILSYQETTKTYNEEEILDIISSNEDVDSFVHCYDSLIALNIYFNNKNCDDGLKIADNYVKNSSIQEINMDINFDEVLTNLINELMSVVKSLEKYTNRKIVRIK